MRLGFLSQRKQVNMFTLAILGVFVLIALVGSLPIWPHSKSWGFRPIVGVSVVILTILILFWTGHL
jgi:hypothetical protein